MDNQTTAKLKAIAPDLIQGKIPDPCPVVGQRAIALLRVLKDNQWHTVEELALQLNIGKRYVATILRIVQNDWGLVAEYNGNKSEKHWKLFQNNEPIIF